ncbi:amidase [Rubrimonas cliftonensis]|uniref:Amino acid/amide ABC transporter ATP-binding protein 2, HAAT family n=1 Tax=Rubrimonas cliftonensis TaxID=89524 RepID=A0A1H4D757_9RHOB|nr:amidase [Rubrimonas cliftonensis]SEA68511.1 amino acid/amide ABC transporter ATP-binding protein 2, HAAT family [Rubrimonas cliftonensis]
MSADVILAARGLRSGYGRVPVLQGLDVTVGAGEILGVLGHNGMGKTTLLKTLMGLVPATGGEITFDGVDVTREGAHRRALLGVGYVPQGRGIFPTLSVRDNLRMGVASHGLEDERAALEAILAEFPQLERLLDRPGGALSGGEQQLLALARCLVSAPDLVLLDEPTEGIQPSIVDLIEDKLRELAEARGLTIILVEQNLEFITGLCDRVLVLQKGQIKGEMARGEMDGALIDEFTGFRSARPAAAPAGGAAMPAVAPSPSPAGPHRNGAMANETPAPAPAPISAPADLTERLARMTVQRPSFDQLKAIVRDFGMNLSDDRIREFLGLMEASMKRYDILDAMPDNLPAVEFPRTAGRRPTEEEDPLNAWYVRTEVRGAPRGPLSGKTIALKDNVCLAGVPMMNGASTLKGYTPDIDATIVTRILEAGGTIVGKAHCEYFCFSGGSHTNATGPTHNPWKRGYSAGGSSSGSAAVVASGQVDMAIGGDQGGSIRMPASFCGVYGMKPTHGLVPYTGVMPIETTIDHTGPMTANVADNALMLEVLAGEDGLDPRQYAPKTDAYTAALGRGARGLRIAVVREGFGRPESEPCVDEAVRRAAASFRDLGASVDEVSIPMHDKAMAIWTAIASEGATNQMMSGNGMGTGWKGLYTTSLLDAHANWRSRADELSETLKITMFTGEYFLRHHRGHYYAKAQNLARRLRAAYDQMLGAYDLLLMPTTAMRATPIPAPDAPLAEVLQRAFEMLNNTAPFDVTGHPAMSLPCALADGLPVGAMLVGKHWAESTIYQAAAAFEAAGDWKSM